MGNSFLESLKRNTESVHPHGRGELLAHQLPSLSIDGSSPRAWGTPESVRYLLHWSRFIPTGVGNSNLPYCVSVCASVHPHGRGELSVDCCQRDRKDGSSPRAWGTQMRSYLYHNDTRFIPTGVGNSTPWKVKAIVSPVHPHGRGELSDGVDSITTSRGSSPRAWGTPIEQDFGYQLPRFIPTGVGNSTSPRICPMAPPVHPHGRGELTTRLMNWSCTRGSSPRAWGTRLR